MILVGFFFSILHLFAIIFSIVFLLRWAKMRGYTGCLPAAVILCLVLFVPFVPWLLCLYALAEWVADQAVRWI